MVAKEKAEKDLEALQEVLKATASADPSFVTLGQLGRTRTATKKAMTPEDLQELERKRCVPPPPPPPQSHAIAGGPPPPSAWRRAPRWRTERRGGGGAQPRYTNRWAPRTRKRHQQEHRPQRPTERSAPTQHAKGRTGDCPGPCKGATTRRIVTQGGGGAVPGDLVRVPSTADWATGSRALERPTTIAPPPPRPLGRPPDQRDHRGKKRTSQLGQSDRALFGTPPRSVTPPAPPYTRLKRMEGICDALCLKGRGAIGAVPERLQSFLGLFTPITPVYMS